MLYFRTYNYSVIYGIILNENKNIKILKLYFRKKTLKLFN